MAGYQALKTKLTAGDDVTPYLSKMLLKSDYEDSLLNDWGIHHFHLGKNVDSSGFINRTGPLLFVFATPTDACCIGVFSHGVWSDQELVRILHRNWPAAISTFRLNGVLGLSQISSNQDIAELRKAGCQTVVEVEQGIVYAPTGGGYSTAGTSIAATLHSDYYLQLIESMETHVREKLDYFLENLSQLKLAPANPPAFSLLVNNDGFFAVEAGSQVAFYCFLICAARGYILFFVTKLYRPMPSTSCWQSCHMSEELFQQSP